MPPRLTIVGLGLIGGSLGMAIRRARVGYEVVGHDRKHEHASQARRLGAVDRAEWNLPSALAGASVVFLAVPPAAMEQVFQDIAPHLEPGCLVTDTASTKQDIMRWAQAILPSSVNFIGGHPMAGKEVSGIAGADADLFVGCTYCLTVQHLANPNALGLLTSLIGTLGAEPFFVDAVEHDSFASAISHLPFLLSTALVRSTSSSPSWRDLKRLAASGYRDVSRLASADPTMHRDICLSNREQLLHWLDAFGSALAEMTAMIRNGSPDLEGVFQSAKETRDEWLAERSRAADR